MALDYLSWAVRGSAGFIEKVLMVVTGQNGIKTALLGCEIGAPV
jgi:hypothetical protein